jgi:hypothetical protein
LYFQEEVKIERRRAEKDKVLKREKFFGSQLTLSLLKTIVYNKTVVHAVVHFKIKTIQQSAQLFFPSIKNL